MIKARARQRKTIAGRVAEVARAAPGTRARAVAAAGWITCVGRLVGWDAQGPLVEHEPGAGRPVRARLVGGAGVRPTPGREPGGEVVLLVDPRGRRAPVLLGVLAPLDAGTGAGVAGDLEARVDGKRVELEGRDEVVLRCGQASITLRANGRVVIRGAHVETRATGTNRIKGGTVEIN